MTPMMLLGMMAQPLLTREQTRLRHHCLICAGAGGGIWAPIQAMAANIPMMEL